MTVTAVWRDGTYDLIGENNAEWVDVRFVAIPGTPEEDYIVQLPVERDGSIWAYVFIWQSEGQYKAVVAPGLIEDTSESSPPLDGFCQLSRARSCEFNNREALYAFYERVFYPRFVEPDTDLHGLLYWTPMNSNEPRSNE